MGFVIGFPEKSPIQALFKSASDTPSITVGNGTAKAYTQFMSLGASEKVNCTFDSESVSTKMTSGDDLIWVRKSLGRIGSTKTLIVSGAIVDVL